MAFGGIESGIFEMSARYRPSDVALTGLSVILIQKMRVDEALCCIQ
ncbi:hypothetical protein EMIT0P12_40142 [Pseudomonas sp. IT-P12]|jgi:hypothetical protein